MTLQFKIMTNIHNDDINSILLGKFWRLFSSTLAAFFGVQTAQNHARDGQNRSPIHFIVMGIILAIMLVLGLLCIVHLVLS